MGKSQPAPPPAPDYAAANRAGIETDIATLPQRRLIEAQARLGQGQFAGLGDADLANQLFQQQLAQAPATTQGLLDLQRQFGTQFADESRRQLQATDPTGFALRDQLGSRLFNGDNTAESLLGGLPAVPNYERSTSFNPTQDAPTFAGREALQQQVFDDLARSGSLDPVLQRSAEQASRARGAARGNILGDSSALQEALAVQQAQLGQRQQAQGNALNLLSSGQSTSDTSNRLGQQAFENAMNSINQRNQASQNEFTAKGQNAQTRLGARQQDLANVQSFLGLQPIVTQGAQLSGLQQGAAPFAQNQYSGANINPNAGAQGAQFAGNIFGTQAGIYGQQLANNQSPLGAILGGFAGAATGGAGSALGTKLGGMFSKCHVAREVYGQDNPRWMLFFNWKEFVAPAWFRWFYNKFSVQLAAMIRPFPAVKNIIRRWMDEKIKEL